MSAWRAVLFSDMHACFLAIFYVLLVNGTQTSSYDFLWKILVLIASLGLYIVYMFLINDYFDITADKIAGKKREIHDMAKVQVVGLIVLIFLSSYIVTLLLIGQTLYTLIYVTAYFLATFYSAPPLRFKGRGILGMVSNVLIEKALPVLLVVSFFQYFYLDALILLVLVSVWEIELILIHQYDDYEADLKAQVKSYVVEIGLKKTLRVLGPLQSLWTLLFVIFSGIILMKVPYSVVFFVFVIIGYFIVDRLRRSGLSIREPRRLGSSRFLPEEDKVRDVRPFYYSFIITCFEGLFPLFSAVVLTLRYILYIIPLLLLIASQYYFVRGYYQPQLQGTLSLIKKYI